MVPEELLSKKEKRKRKKYLQQLQKEIKHLAWQEKHWQEVNQTKSIIKNLKISMSFARTIAPYVLSTGMIASMFYFTTHDIPLEKETMNHASLSTITTDDYEKERMDDTPKTPRENRQTITSFFAIAVLTNGFLSLVDKSRREKEQEKREQIKKEMIPINPKTLAKKRQIKEQNYERLTR